MKRAGIAGALLLAGLPFAPAAWSADTVAARSACPLRFDERTVGRPQTCLFVGRYSGSCGGPALAVFAGNGATVAVGLAFSQSGSTTYFAGDVASKTEANLVIWQRSLQMLAASHVSGLLTLEDDGHQLRVRLASAPFTVGGCRFGEYVGHFVDMVDAGDALPDESQLAAEWPAHPDRRSSAPDKSAGRGR
jgi:hypothetical protein